MLGANIDGIPGQENPFAFWELSGLIILLMLVQALLLRRIGWL
jgi:Mg2+ and Co2+ transporter CorA